MRRSDLVDLIESEATKLEALHSAIDRTFVNRDKGDETRRAWDNACEAFHTYRSRMDPFLERACEEERYTDSELLEFVVAFLEVDPWFFRSGYLKQILLTRLKRSDLSEPLRQRLRRVLIDAARRRGTREFKYYCRLAVSVADQELESELEVVRAGTDAAAAHRAKMMLEAIRNHSEELRAAGT